MNSTVIARSGGLYELQHKTEALYKAAARAVSEAVTPAGSLTLSTKGALG